MGPVLRRILSVAVAVAATTGAAAAAATAAPPASSPGNSGTAQACQQGGWQSLYRADGTAFANQGACVSYGAQGGTPTATPFSDSQMACEDFGGTFAFGSGNPLWTCDGWGSSNLTETTLQEAALTADCQADGGSELTISTAGTVNRFDANCVA